LPHRENEEVIVDAQCNGCGGRVMPYTQYVAHFRPTAVCESCGERVRMRHYRAVLGTAFAAVLALAVVVALTSSRALAIVGVALGTLLGFLADFWTFRNLSWDPVEEVAPRERTSV
jgi:hypothetical protein